MTETTNGALVFEAPEQPTTDVLIGSIDAEIAKATEHLDALTFRKKEIVAAADAALADARAHLQRLTAARGTLAGMKRRRRRTVSPAGIAGPKVIEAVKGVLAGGPISQRQLAQRLPDVNRGSITYAIRALTEAGEIRDTGRLDGRSKVYALKGGRRVPPGE